jgi:hypothetical protein
MALIFFLMQLLQIFGYSSQVAMMRGLGKHVRKKKMVFNNKRKRKSEKNGWK